MTTQLKTKPNKCFRGSWYEELLVPKLRYNILSLDESGCYDMQVTIHRVRHDVRGFVIT